MQKYTKNVSFCFWIAKKLNLVIYLFVCCGDGFLIEYDSLTLKFYPKKDDTFGDNYVFFLTFALSLARSPFGLGVATYRLT